MKINRRSLFATMLAAPFAAVAAFKQAVGAKSPKLPELMITIGCDTSEFSAAMDRLCAEMEKWDAPPTAEELRAQMDGMPPIIITCDGKEIDRYHVLL